MARTLTRSGGASQVTPDTTMARRFSLPCSWDVPVSKAKKTAPLMATGRKRSILDQVQIYLTLTTDGADISVPQLAFEGGRGLFTVTKDGADLKRVIRGAGVLTITSKMTCPSISPTAGPTKEGGTCAIANTTNDKETCKRLIAEHGTEFGVAGGLRTIGKQFICDGCYSLEGFYITPSTAAAQAIRQKWIEQQLRADPTGVLLGDQLAALIEDYARNVTLVGVYGGGMETRLTQEIGVWKDGQICVPARLPAIGEHVLTPAYPNPRANQWFRQRGVPEGATTGFFRIHDSGDFTLAKSAALWPGYISAWAHAARKLPYVMFWAPTRIWVMPQLKRRMLKELQSTPNLIIRPSTLNVNDPAPIIEGFANGTTVASQVGHKSFTQTFDDAGRPCHTCPVYMLEVGNSCMAAGCRVCWLSPEVPVAYGWH